MAKICVFTFPAIANWSFANVRKARKYYISGNDMYPDERRGLQKLLFVLMVFFDLRFNPFMFKFILRRPFSLILY